MQGHIDVHTLQLCKILLLVASQYLVLPMLLLEVEVG
jgi:hypothetical protein